MYIKSNYIFLYGDGCYLDLCGDHFTTYIRMKSLHCTPENNTMLYVNYNAIKQTKVTLDLPVQ